MKKTTYINKTEHKEKTTTVIENMYGMLMSYVNVYSRLKESHSTCNYVSNSVLCLNMNFLLILWWFPGY